MIEIKTLSSGIRLVTERLNESRSACIGIWVGAGACMENSENSGISHYIEHMFFKGTLSRNAKQLATDIDNLGANVNAFTGKEATCFHIKSVTDRFPEAVDILLDMLKNPRFDEKDIKKERGVILEEKSMVEDTPDDYIIDLITEKTLAGTDIANSIIGTVKSLHKVKRQSIIDYIKTYYTRDRIVVSCVGNFDENVLINQLDKAFDDFAPNGPERGENKLSDKPRYGSVVKDISQSHICLGMPTITLFDDKYYAQAIVNDVFGGSMSSMLFQNIREERGLAYTVYSAPMSFSAAGMMYIYMGLSLGHEEEAVDAVRDELKLLGSKGISSDQVEIVKQRLKAGFIFSEENMNSRMYRLGKNLLLLGRIYTEEDTLAEISAVTPAEVNEYCEFLSDMNKYSAVVISKNKIDIKSLVK